MQKAKQISLYTAIICWAVIIGGVMYSHIVYMPAYLGHLPESNQLITGKFGLRDENFWMLIHPWAILITILTLILNWREPRRKFILIPFIIYATAILLTALYFVPELKAFAASDNTAEASSLLKRAELWQYRSWIRGAVLFLGFTMLLVALEKKSVNN